MMDARGGRARSTRKPRLSETERKAKAARPNGRGRLPRVVKARGGRIPTPANDTLPPHCGINSRAGQCLVAQETDFHAIVLDQGSQDAGISR